jgi:hypothetical protein
MHFPRFLLAGVLWVTPAVLRADDAWRPLFNGRNLDGWTTFLAKPEAKWGWNVPDLKQDAAGNYVEPIGFNKDPLGVFKVETVDGQPAIHISGQGFGVMTTVQPFTNYDFKVQIKWGESKWGYKIGQPRDAGLLYRCVGLAGLDHATWPHCLEFQIQEQDFGDLYALGSTQVTVNAVRVPPSALPAPADGKRTPRLWIYDPKGEPTLFVQRAPIGNRCKRVEDRELPHGEWNQLELIVVGSNSIHIVNGKVVMRLHNAQIRLGSEILPLTSGQISLQTEGAECYYRDPRIRSIDAVPAELAEQN